MNLKHVNCWAVLVGKPFEYEKHFKSLFSKRYCMIIHRLVDVHSLFYFLPYTYSLILPEYSMSWKVGFKKKTWYSHGFDWRILKDVCVHAHATMLQPCTVTKTTREKKRQPPLIPTKMGAQECCLPLLRQSRNTV